MSDGLTVVRRIWFTPWIDLLHLRLSGRLDWTTDLEGCDLPGGIRSMIHEVVYKSKLTTGEKASVTSELIAHFQDGLDAGQTAVQMIESFGDVEFVSRLIQRGKERNRSMFVKAIKVLGGVSALTVAVAIVWLVLFANRRANPVVDYVPNLNVRAVAANPMEKAWPIYRDAWTGHRFVTWDPNRDLPEGHPGLEHIRPGDPEWETALGMLDQRQDLIVSLRQGAQLTALGLELKGSINEYSEADQQALFPGRFENTTAEQRQASANDDDEEHASTGGDVIGVLLPHIQAMRMAGRLLVIDSRRAVEQGNVQRAIENVDLTFGLAHQASEPACLVAALVGLATADLAFLQVDELITTHNAMLSNEDLVHLQEIVAKQDFRKYLQLDGERTIIPDLLQACYTDDGNGDGRITRTGLSMMTGLFPAMMGEERQESNLEMIWTILFSSRKEIQSAVDSWFDLYEPILDKAWYEDSRTGDAIIADLAAAETAQRYLMDSLLPAVDGVRAALQARLARQETCITAIALHRARRVNGAWPKTLNELVPDFIEKVAVDRMTGDEILYRLDPGPVLYSPGPDGDDDHGAPLTDPNGRRQQFCFVWNADGWEGDCVMWPVVEPN